MKKKRRNISDNTGKGKDRKGMKQDGLRYNWIWTRQCDLSMAPRDDKRRLPCQVCYTEFETSLGWLKFEAVGWHDGYEARVNLRNERLVSIKNFPTRLEAQLAAEKGIIKFAKDLLKIVDN